MPSHFTLCKVIYGSCTCRTPLQVLNKSWMHDFGYESHSSQVLCLCVHRSWKCLRRGWSRWLWSLEENLPSLSSKTVSWRMQWRGRSWQTSWHRDRWRSFVNHALCRFLIECATSFNQPWQVLFAFCRSAAMGPECMCNERFCPSSWRRWWRGLKPSLWVTLCWRAPEWEHWSANRIWRKCWDLSSRPRNRCLFFNCMTVALKEPFIGIKATAGRHLSEN